MKKLLILVVMLVMLCGCSQDNLTEVMNIKYNGYTAEEYDSLIDKVFEPSLAEKVKLDFASGLRDKEISINDIMEQAERDRYLDVVAEAYKRGVGYTKKPNIENAVYDDEIYANYVAGDLDYLKNNDLDYRINRNGDNYSVTLSEIKKSPLENEVILDIYGHQYTLDISGYELDTLYKGYEPYNFVLDTYCLYSDGTLDISFKSKDYNSLPQNMAELKAYTCTTDKDNKITDIKRRY